MIWYIRLKYAFLRWRTRRRERLQEVEREEQLKSCSNLAQLVVTSLQNSPEDWEFGEYYATWIPSKGSSSGEIAVWTANEDYALHMKGESRETTSLTALERRMIFAAVCKSRNRKRLKQLFRLEP